MDDVVRSPLYETRYELVAAEELAEDPAFWLAHLWRTAREPQETAERFGTDTADLDAVLDRLSDEARPWPVLRVPFAGGHTAVVVYRNFPDESGIDFFVHHPDWGRTGHLGSFDGHDAGPGLTWAELTAIAASPADGREGLDDPSQRLLLLLPMLGDADTPDDAAAVVERALTECGIPADRAAETAVHLLDTSFFGDGAHWCVTDVSPLAVCDEPHSPRRVPLARGVTDAQARALADALAGRAAGA
ncbi:hypothetical protein [Streptomyces chryseus]|uniref:hypothetical protein n=1 Tax=Streptomyces chryseus TaxID=68186 RepID=UPI00110FB0C6|nr:hypothetical protein [Streptomyces chryseus]GGW91228.1 hypothetical protein GCM10010353_03090 [Streptomyces chryseus]